MNNNDLFDDLEENQIDDLIKYVAPFSDVNATNIKNKFFQTAKAQKKRIAFRKVILSVFLVSIFSISTLVYAGVIDFNKIYQAIFGDNDNYLEKYIKTFDDNNESEYNGIVIKLISAIRDEDEISVFLTVTDTTDDRLNETTSLGELSSSLASFGGYIMDYNEDSKTATIYLTSSESFNGNVTLNFKNFISSREYREDLKEDKINVYDILKDNMPKTMSQDEGICVNGYSGVIDTEAKLLCIDEKAIEFENIDWSYISNIGFVDGCLHIQTNKSVHDRNDIVSINFVNSDGEIVYDGLLNLSYVDNVLNEFNPDTKEYTETIYEGITDIEQLKDLSIAISIVEFGKPIEGEWEVSFEAPDKIIKTEISVDRELHLVGNEYYVDKISLSPIGIIIHLPKYIDYADDLEHYDSVSVEYSDGTIIKLDKINFVTLEDSSSLKYYGNVIEIEKIKSIIINGEVISVDSTQANSKVEDNFNENAVNLIKDFFEEPENRSFDVSFPKIIKDEECYIITVTGKTENGTYPMDVFAINTKGDKRYFLDKETGEYVRFYGVPTFACKTSPNGKLRIECVGMKDDYQSGLQQLREKRIINIITGEVLWDEPSAYQNKYVWSSDSRFVSIEESGRIWTTTDVVDTTDMSCIILPDLQYILENHPNATKPNDNNPLPLFKGVSWVSNSVIQIDFEWWTLKDTTVFGTYEYNVLEKTMEIKAIDEKSRG